MSILMSSYVNLSANGINGLSNLPAICGVYLSPHILQKPLDCILALALLFQLWLGQIAGK